MKPEHTAAVEEGRELAKGKTVEQNRVRTQGRSALRRALDRIRAAARQDRAMRLTALWHHVYDLERLREAYYGLNRAASPGVDGETWASYGANLEANLRHLSDRLKRGTYHASPVERVYIPKADGRQRPIGIPTLEDKIVQRATVEVLNAIYEQDVRGFSYGFRPGRSPHDALDAVTVGIEKRNINGVLDVDIRGCFDAIDHAWLVKFVEHRIGDRRVVRHRWRWLKAGVLEDGQWREQEEGTPQGGSISPLAANIYLHDVLDLWTERWRRRDARGAMIIVRFADDVIVGFEHRDAAVRFWAELRERFQQFHLELHPEKTRLSEFGRFAAERRQRRGQGRPETFDFLGLTHMCSKTRTGKLTVRRKTIATRLRQKLQEVKAALRERRHWPIPQQGAWLRSVLLGHSRYSAVPRNGSLLRMFRETIMRYWCQTLRRRSQRHRLTWQRMYTLAERWLPPPHILHPYPAQRLRVTTQGRSPVRECRTPGSVRGVSGNRRPYRDRAERVHPTRRYAMMREGVESETYFQRLSHAAPGAQLLHLITGYWVSAAIGVAAELGLADLLADGPRASTDLATMTGSHAVALSRLLQTLASVGLFSEVEPGCFALTEMGALLRQEHPASLYGFTRYACGNREWRLFGALRHSVATGQPAQHHVFGSSSPAYWAQHPEERAIFDAAMRSTTAQVMDAVVHTYDFTPFHTVVDVGGGHGALLTAILSATPGLRGILLDRPGVTEGAQPHLAAAGVLDRCEIVGGDMFTEVPRGADAYVFSRVIHDWDDARAVAALASCRRAIGPTGQLLLVEEVIPSGDTPAYGKLSDLNMLVGPGGQERTEAEYRALYTAAGFALTQVIPTLSRMSILVGVPHAAREA